MIDSPRIEYVFDTAFPLGRQRRSNAVTIHLDFQFPITPLSINLLMNPLTQQTGLGKFLAPVTRQRRVGANREVAAPRVATHLPTRGLFLNRLH
jgi:hypothetical protein